MQPPKPKKVNTDTAQVEMLKGVEIVYKAVSSTLGPRSKNVAIKRPFGAPAVVHDGVTVARSILPLPDAEQDTGAEMIVGATEATNEVGDGTTTTAIITREIAVNAYKNITAGARTMALREGIEDASDAIIRELDTMVTPIAARGDKGGELSKELLMVATVSAQVEDIGRMVAEAYNELGDGGVLTVEEGRSSDSYLELKQGMQFDSGWVDPWFITPGNTLGEAVIDNANIVVTDNTINDPNEFGRMLMSLVTKQEGEDAKGLNDIVVIASGYSGEVVGLTLRNTRDPKIGLRALLVGAPLFGEKRIEVLKDIAIVTGADFISETLGKGLQSVTKNSVGHAKQVKATKDTTLIVDGAGNKEAVAARVAEIKGQLGNNDLSAFDREKLKERLARLESGVGVLMIGARSETEVKERKERAIDAVSAAKAALDGGVVAGGGMALLTAAAKVEAELLAAADDHDPDWRFGVKIVLDACRAPYEKLLRNSGYEPGEKMAEVRAKQKKAGPIMGVDVMDGQVVDMVKEGIIDPLLVVKAAIGNATSAAVGLFTSDTVITEIPDVKEYYGQQ